MSIKLILVPTDFEQTSSPAVEYAFSLARRLAAKVHLLHVYSPVVVPDGKGSGAIPYAALHSEALERLQRVAKPYAGSPALGSCLVEMGDPSTTILDRATQLGADLIVVGTHARVGLSRILLGSVAETVIREATCPVLVAKGAALQDRSQPSGERTVA